MSDAEMSDAEIAEIERVAELVGLTSDDECTPDGIDWGFRAPAEGAPVFVEPGYHADDGNCDVHYPDAETACEAAKSYAADGDWGVVDETGWITVHTWQECRSIDEDGNVVTGQYGYDSHSIAIEPTEPDCLDGDDHDWQSPYEIVGGIESNPGVWAHGGGVVYHECCMRCGCRRTIDTWAQDPETGRQGLRSVRYEPGHYAEQIAEVES